MIEFDHVSLLVNNVDTSMAFYEKSFGFKPKRVFEPAPKVKIAILGLGTAELGLYEVGSIKSEAAANVLRIGSPTIVFKTNDIQADYKRLADSGVQFRGAPKAGKGYINCQGLDPDNAIFELVQYM